MTVALTVITLAGFAVMLLGLVAFFLRVRGDDTVPRGNYDARGTTFRPDRLADVAIRSSLIGGVTAMLLFAVLQPLGLVDIPVPHSMRYYLPTMAAVGALAGAPLLFRLFGRGSLSYLLLTPAGFEIAEGRSPVDGRWSEVTEVGYRPPNGPAPKANSIVFVMSDGTAPMMAAGSYTPDGIALRRLVHFYWKHPDSRDELTDGRAIDRLRDGDFRRGAS